MSGGGFASSARQSPAQGINSVFGTNILGAGGVSNDWGTRQANNLTGFNVFNAGNNALDAAAAGQVPGTLPNLGASSLIPKMAGGAFMPVNTAGGKFNAMANQAAGPLFNPAARPPAQQTQTAQTQAPSPEITALIQRFLSQGTSRSPFMGMR